MAATSELEKIHDGASLMAEANKLLRLAEALEEKCESRERKLLLTTTGGLLAALAALVLGGWLSLSSPILSSAERWRGTFLVFAPGAIGALLAVGAIPAVLIYSVYRLRIQERYLIRRDRRAIHSIVDTLRETEKAIADRHNLSALERLEFQIRLSRFDIGPGTYA